AVHPGTLLQPPVVLLDGPGRLGVRQPAEVAQAEVLVNQCCVSPPGATTRNTLTKPNSGSQASVPAAAAGNSATAVGGPRSLRSLRLAGMRARKVHPRPRTALRFSALAYQPSKSTARGRKPRAAAAARIDRKWSFLVRPSVAWAWRR